MAGKDNVLHLDIEPGTDIALFNGLFTYVVEQGWHDKDFIAQHTAASTWRVAPTSCRSTSAAESRAFPSAKLRQAAEWAYKPKAAGQRTRTMHAYEKGIIWGNDNYLIQSALVDLVLATHNVGRRGTGCRADGWAPGGLHAAALPGRQENLHRPGNHPGPRPHVHGVGCNPFQTTLNAEQHRQVILRRAGHRQGSDGQGARRLDRADGRRHRTTP